MKKENIKLIVVDASSILSTQYFGNLPPAVAFAKKLEDKEANYHKILQTSDGKYINGVFGLVKYIMKLKKDLNFTHIAFAWDITRDTFRRDIYKEYKANRDETPLPLKEQFKLAQELLNEMGFYQLMDNKYEADDFLGTLSKKFENEVPVYILTKDRDALQLVSDNTRLWLLQTSNENCNKLFEKYCLDKKLYNIPERCFEFTPHYVKEEFGVYPEQIVDLKALIGDDGDNIPGVKGCGLKSAIPLINEYENIENLYDSIRDLSKSEEKELKEFWKELGIKRSPLNYLLKTSDTEIVGEQSALLSKQLGKIKCDIELDVSLDDFKYEFDKDRCIKAFEKLEFKSLINDYDKYIK